MAQHRSPHSASQSHAVYQLGRLAPPGVQVPVPESHWARVLMALQLSDPQRKDLLGARERYLTKFETVMQVGVGAGGRWRQGENPGGLGRWGTGEARGAGLLVAGGDSCVRRAGTGDMVACVRLLRAALTCVLCPRATRLCLLSLSAVPCSGQFCCSAPPTWTRVRAARRSALPWWPACRRRPCPATGRRNGQPRCRNLPALTGNWARPRVSPRMVHV